MQVLTDIDSFSALLQAKASVSSDYMLQQLSKVRRLH